MVFRGKFRILEMTILSYSAAAVTLLFSLILISTTINCDSGIGGSGSGGTGSYTPSNRQRTVIDRDGSSVTASNYGRVKGVVYNTTDTTAISGVMVSIGNIISATTGTDGKYDLYKVPITIDFSTENKTVKADGGVI